VIIFYYQPTFRPPTQVGFIQGNVFHHKTCSIPITRNNE